MNSWIFVLCLLYLGEFKRPTRGEKVYEGGECDNSWNGYYNGTLAPNGVYAYLVNAIGADGKRYVFSEDVTLMR
ncbi:MAG: gliding motility-associated C-terminal domain-containing protein [Bacteroidetes bacterium]|nr:gliding motility-associated C-terminal domain-containing protein [Bacteroidota bacterium]